MGKLSVTPVDFTLYGHEIGRKFWLAHSYADLAALRLASRRTTAKPRRCGSKPLPCVRRWASSVSAPSISTSMPVPVSRLGKVRGAVDLARRGLAYSQAFGDQIGIAFGQMTLGMAMAAQGQWTVAAAYLQQSLAMARQSGHRFMHVLSAVHLGRVLLAQGRRPRRKHCRGSVRRRHPQRRRPLRAPGHAC